MASHRVWLKLYVGVVVAGGVAALAAALPQWGMMDLGVWERVLFIGLAGILDVMVVPVSGGGAVAASFAVLFAGLLVLGAGPTAWVAALAAVWSEGVVRRRPVVRVCFNASHSVLSLMAAGWVYGALGGEVGGILLADHVPAVMGAAVALWLLETAWMSAAVAFEQGGRIWRRLQASLGPVLAWDGALASAGLLLALLYQSRAHLVGASSWQGALLLGATVLIPCGLLYYAYRLQGHLRDVYSQSLRTLGALLEAKVEGSRPGHGEKVAKLAAALAETLELAPEQVEQIRYAGYLHDIGKVGVPSTLLQRQRDRFQAEPHPVRQHAQIGAGILSPVQFLQPAAQILRAHHERWDGLGYPNGLRRADIPLGARILALANTYVGLTTSGNPTFTPSQALSRLHQSAGSLFDPELVRQVLPSLVGGPRPGAPRPAALTGREPTAAAGSWQ
jgi:putative nucleotidyltransferase with HDIG domain